MKSWRKAERKLIEIQMLHTIIDGLSDNLGLRAPVCIVKQALARQQFQGENLIGSSLAPVGMGFCEVVGVAAERVGNLLFIGIYNRNLSVS